MNRDKLYRILLVASLAGYTWLFYQKWGGTSEGGSGYSGCPIKFVTGIPCPSCGTTRAMLELWEGHWKESLWLNPNGFLLAVLMVVVPLWIVIDLATGRAALYNAYRRAEHWIRQPRIGIPLLILVVLNWYWNIVKQL